MRMRCFVPLLLVVLLLPACASGGLFENSADLAGRVANSGTFTVMTLSGPTVESSVVRRSGRSVRRFRVTGQGGRLEFRVLPEGQLDVRTGGSEMTFGCTLEDGWEIDLESDGSHLLLPERDREFIVVRDTGRENVVAWN